MGVSFVTVYKMAESVARQMRNCVCKTQTATTGTRPPLVASQYRRQIKAFDRFMSDYRDANVKILMIRAKAIIFIVDYIHLFINKQDF